MRYFLLSLSFAIPLSALAADANSTQPPSKELKIYFGRGITRSSIQKYADQYLADTNINILDVQTPRPQEDLNADIYCNSHDVIWDLYAQGLLQPITPSANTRAKTVTLGWDALSFEGQYYGYPLAMEATVLAYNKDLIDSLPKSFEEFAELNNQLQKTKKISAIDWNYTNARLSWPLMSAGGMSIFGRDENKNYAPKQNNANSISAITAAFLIKKWVDQQILHPLGSVETAEQRFVEGKVAAILIEPSSWAYLKQSSINWEFAALPTIDGIKATPLVNAWGCAITAKADAAIAKDFIENYLMKPDTLTALFQARSGGVPTQKDVFKTNYSQPALRQLFNIINVGQPIPGSEATERFWSNMNTALQPIREGEAPTKALDKAAERVAQHP